MKQSWINKKEKERQEEIAELTNQIRDALLSLGDYDETEVQIFIDHIDEMARIGLSSAFLMIPDEPNLRTRLEKDPKLLIKTIDLIKTLPYKELLRAKLYSYTRYADSTPKHFHGDIIITDPGYVIKDEDWDAYCKRVDEPDYDGFIPGHIARNTIYGDWSCTTFDAQTKKPIGKFCADAGLVGVFDLAKTLEYNPEFDYHTERTWTTTLIKDFDGDVWFKIKHHNTSYGDDYSVHVVGKGHNIKTGEPIEFITHQTGL